MRAYLFSVLFVLVFSPGTLLILTFARLRPIILVVSVSIMFALGLFGGWLQTRLLEKTGEFVVTRKNRMMQGAITIFSFVCLWIVYSVLKSVGLVTIGLLLEIVFVSVPWYFAGVSLAMLRWEIVNGKKVILNLGFRGKLYTVPKNP